MSYIHDDRVFIALSRFAENIKVERRADVVMDGVGTGVHASYFPDDIMEVEGLPELPPILRFEQKVVKALQQGRFEQLPEEAAQSFNIFRLFDPRTVMAGLHAPSRYNELAFSFEADLDVRKAGKTQGFALDEQLMEWLHKYERVVQPAEFVLIDDDIRRMTLLELPPGDQKITLIFFPGNYG